MKKLKQIKFNSLFRITKAGYRYFIYTACARRQVTLLDARHPHISVRGVSFIKDKDKSTNTSI